MNFFKNSHTYSFGLMLVIGVALISLVTVGDRPQAQNSCFTQPAGMAAWYPGDGNPNDILQGTSGTRQGNAAYATGQVGQAFSFDGVNSSVSIGNPTSLQLQDFTIEAWVKRGSSTVATLDPVSGGQGAIFAYGQNGYVFFLGDDGHLSLYKGVSYAVFSNQNGFTNFPDLKITDTNFHHVAVTKSGENVTFYLDGVMGRTQGFFAPFEFTTNAHIGAYSDSIRYSFLGLIDELSIYNRGLNQSDIQAIFNAGAAGKCKATSVQFEFAKYPSGSTSGTVTVKVTRTGDTSSASSVDYATSNGTAKAGKNYTSTSGTLNFASGDQSKTVTVPILNDTATTTDTNFQLVLSSPAGTTLGAVSSTTLNIFAIPNGSGRLLSLPQDSTASYLHAVNPDGTNSFQVTSYRGGTHVDFPSVSRLTGLIAFNGCGEFFPTGSSCFVNGRRVYVMNADGSGLRQVTNDTGLVSPLNQNDDRSIVSPDGSKIAFISGRPPANDDRPEVWVVNTDGTGLHQITTHQNVQNLGESKALGVVWSPDSQKLLVHALRLDNDTNGNQTLGIGSLFTYNADGTGEALFRRGVSVGSTMALDWSPDGRRILYPLIGGPSGATFGYVILDAQNPDKSTLLSGTQLDAAGTDNNGYNISGGFPGSVRFSPDGKKILYGDLTHRTLRTINLDGTNITSTPALSDSDYFAKWWWPGAAIPQPHHLTLTPNAVTVFGTQTAQVTPTLYDNNNNVIFHNADFYNTTTTGLFLCNDHPCTVGNNALFDTHITTNGLVYNNNTTANGVLTLCGANAGFNTCTLVAVNFESIGVTTTTPLIRKSGADGAGVFNFTRRVNPNSTSSASQLVPFVLSGAGINGTDYFLTDASGNRISGSVFTIPAGQNNFVIKVVPLSTPSSGDKAVTLTIKTDDINYNYVADGLNTSATVTIKDDHPEQTALSLSLITPNKGGDTGAVSVTIFGANINPAATVKLARSGQSDITGTSVKVAPNGTSLTATFDLTGKVRGAWSVVVTNPDNKSATLLDGFTIEEGRGSHIWTDVIGRYTMRSALEQTFYVAYGNTGNSDAPATIIQVSLPPELTVVQPPQLADGSVASAIDWGGETLVQFLVPNVPANSTVYVPMRLRTSVAHQDVEIKASANSSTGYQEIASAPVDPGIQVTPEVKVNTPDHLQMNAVAMDSAGNKDEYSLDVTLLTGTPPDSPQVTVVETDETTEYTIIAGVPASSNPLNSAQKHLQGPEDNPILQTIKTVWKVISNFNKTRVVIGQHKVVNQAAELKNLQEYLSNCFGRKTVTTLLYPIDKEEIANLNRYAEAAVIMAEAKWLSSISGPAGIPGQELKKGIDGLDNLAGRLWATELSIRLVRDIHDNDDPLKVQKDGTFQGKYPAWLHKVVDDNWDDTSYKDGQGDSFQSNITKLANTHIRRAIFSWLLQMCCADHYRTPFQPTDMNPASVSRSGLSPTGSDCGCPDCDEFQKLIDLFIVSSGDPNDKAGPQGAGDKHYITGAPPLSYSIFFENKPAATAPAQTVTVTDQLDASKVDFSTFQLGPVSFGSRFVAPPAGLSQWTTDIDLRPSNNLIVRVNAGLNKSSGLLQWTFTSLDPATGQPTTDPLAGFLPPNKTSPEGEGSVLFSVTAKQNLAIGTEIRNKARIVFDLNAPIDTPEWLNTVDNSVPASHVAPLASNQNSIVFNVTWAGQDTGSGIQTYDVFVSANGGSFTQWLRDTNATSAMFIAVPGKSYSFYSVAHDGAGNLESAKTVSEASTSTSPSIVNAIDDPRYFVWRHYRDFLSRDPDQGGLDFWTNQITACGNDAQCAEVRRINVSAAFFLSIEFQETGYLAYLTYKEAYGNLPGAPVPVRRDELLTDSLEISNGVVVLQTGWEQLLESNKQAFMLDFVQRSRFTSAFLTTMTPAAFVDKLYLNAGVTPSASDRTNAINEFGVASTTVDVAARARVLRRVTDNAAFRQQELNKAFVLMEYFGYLRRNPNDAPDSDFAGYNFWLTKLNQFNGNYINAEMVKAFISSIEYRQRFAP